ncbi:hypothetical protein BDY24DRAFT_387048 [Mrakia frigida]|uniref:uncharacterized protein n=1 Tax=Mrakia frigida TaxID=29902 RepID=UPI003FCBFFF8
MESEERKRQGATAKQLRALEREDQRRAEEARKQIEKEQREESMRQTFGLRPPEPQVVVAPVSRSFARGVVAVVVRPLLALDSSLTTLCLSSTFPFPPQTYYSYSQAVTPKQSFFRSSLKPPKRPQLFKPPPTIPVKSTSKPVATASKPSLYITPRVIDSQTQSRVFPGMSRSAAYAIMSLEEEDAKARGVPGWKDSGWR